ncbi:hypothetical protein B0H17DRAFT_1185541 [Mycena rosella]|uniref:Uncharacterized protein n=1 Tax=Mycena rosella TaxID=1033263 RepID=A0AAD7CRD5_MYCRO|nr:hypothetical protein B0H17DRAFT_1185541 [Mycena rosella]
MPPQTSRHAALRRLKTQPPPPQTALKVLSALPDFVPGETPEDPEITAELAADPEYWQVLQNDVVALAHSIVTACRDSGQRRADFEETTEKGNENGDWGATRAAARRRPTQGCRHAAIDALLSLDKYSELLYLLLTDLELQVLRDVRQFFQVPHVVQELVSAEKTPTLCIRQLPKLGHAISAAIRKLEEYLALSRRAPIYALAMGHPSSDNQIKWIEDHWSAEDYQQARTSVRASMLEYQRDIRLQGTASGSAVPQNTSRHPVNSSTNAARAQRSGMARLSSLARSISGASPHNTNTPPQSTPTAQSECDAEERGLGLEDEHIVDEELRKYEAEAILDGDSDEHENFVL